MVFTLAGWGSCVMGPVFSSVDVIEFGSIPVACVLGLTGFVLALRVRHRGVPSERHSIRLVVTIALSLLLVALTTPVVALFIAAFVFLWLGLAVW
jgi:hypothetical protein